MNEKTNSVSCLGSAIAFAAAAAFIGTLPAWAAGEPETAKASVKLPPGVEGFKDGPNVAKARTYCVTCHSPDYVYMQPPLTRAVWQAEVTKMRKVFGAPIPEAEVTAIVDYLVSQNGKP